MRGIPPVRNDSDEPATLNPRPLAPGEVVVTRAPSDFVSSLSVLGRRWKVVVVGLILTFGLAAMAMVAIPATYKATGSQILLASSSTDGAATTDATGTDGKPKTINPYLAFGGSIKATAEILAKVMNSDATAEQVLATGATGKYVADLAPGDAPIITITATGKTPDEALFTQQQATAVTEATLEATQRRAGAKTDLLQVNAVVTPSVATKESSSRIRALIGILVLGIAATVLVTFMIESVAQHRAARRAARPVTNEGEVRPLAVRRADGSEARLDTESLIERLERSINDDR